MVKLLFLCGSKSFKNKKIKIIIKKELKFK
jgi:hypothetical protein